MKLLHYILPAALLLSACASEGTLPQSFSETKDSLQLFPDYRDIVIPPNIAPLNVQVKNAGSAYAASITGKKGEIIVNADADGKLLIDSIEWRQLLNENKGGTLRVAIYA